MSGAAEATSTATPAPEQGEQSATPKPEGAEIITRERMAEFVKKRAEARGETIEEGQDKKSGRPRDQFGRFLKPDVKQDESLGVEQPEVDDPEAKKPEEKKDEQKPDPERAKLQERVAFFEGREPQWAELVDTLVTERDTLKERVAMLEAALPQIGYEVDPRADEVLTLKQKVARFEAEQERMRLAAEQREQMARQQQHQTLVNTTVQKLGELARKYPELDPRKNPSAADFLRRAALYGDDLEKDAIAWVQMQRAKRMQVPQAPRTLVGQGRGMVPQKTTASTDWNDIRAAHRAKFGQG